MNNLKKKATLSILLPGNVGMISGAFFGLNDYFIPDRLLK